MKLTRNKIRKIRKQQQQSVRKWKKARKSMRRKASTFRRSRAEIATDNDNNTSYPLKLKNVLNKTLKRYIPLPVLSYLKERYQNMKRLRQRKQRREKMIGGAHAASAAASAAAASAVNDTNTTVNDPANSVSDPAANSVSDPAANTVSDPATNPDSDPASDNTKPSFNLGPDIPGDISIKSDTYELKKNEDSQHLLTFLVNNGLPYYIQIEMKPDGKKLNRHNTDIFDLRRILYGKFATKKDFETPGKIPDDKHELYFQAPQQVGIADGDTMGNEYPSDIFIFTGEKGTVDHSSSDKSIKIAITGSKNEPVVVLDSRRLYKLAENGSPASIDDFDSVMKFVETTESSEFRVQVAPMSEDDFNKAVAISSSDGSDKKGKKVITDDTNSYVVNLSVGCKVTSIQTLRKSLEKARIDLENPDDDIKTNALDVFKMLIGILQNPDFVKNEGYDDFKKNVYAYSYIIPGQEKRYGLAQLSTYFTQNNENLSPVLVKTFFNLMRLLDQGPMGENGACVAFESPGLPMEFQTLVKPLAEGKVKEVTKLTNKGNITGIAALLQELSGDVTPSKDAKTKKSTDVAAASSPAAPAAAAPSPAAPAAAASSPAAPAAAASSPAASAEAASNPAAATPSSDDKDKDKDNEIKEIDAIDSYGYRYKAYLIKKFSFPELEDMNLVHFMGWGTATDEFIPESEASTRILPRDDKSNTGQAPDQDTIEKIMKIYKKVDMTKMESKAKEKAEEYKNEQMDVTEAKTTNAKVENDMAAAAAAAAAASAAAASAAAAASKRS